MELIARFLDIAAELGNVFGQRRTAARAVSLMLAGLLCVGRHWITRWRMLRGGKLRGWSSDYRLFSRACWDADRLFLPVLRHSLPFTGSGPVVLAGDETRVKRGGKRVKRSRWTRDPMSPPFHTNFMKGIRFCQFSVILPLHQQADGVSARAVPVSFRPVDLPPKPGRDATPEELEAYRKASQENRMCIKAVDQLKTVRQLLDEAGAAGRRIRTGLDGGFCNGTVFTAELDRTDLVARCRKDAVLCLPAQDPAHPARVYDPRTFTPEDIRQDDQRPWHEATVFFGGKPRSVRYKDVGPVLWRGGAKRRRLRLLVVAPTPYRPSPRSRTYYRQPAYLLATELDARAGELLQCYFDRWQIEVNHRDEKQQIGIADPQVWNDQSVDRLPAFMVASYSFLLLASLEAYGPSRTDAYIQPPPWQRRRTRPSCEDILALLRTQAAGRDGPQADRLPFHYDILAAISRSAA